MLLPELRRAATRAAGVPAPVLRDHISFETSSTS
jgi:hypothetical protein